MIILYGHQITKIFGFIFYLLNMIIESKNLIAKINVNTALTQNLITITFF
jgi:hypothetical protein